MRLSRRVLLAAPLLPATLGSPALAQGSPQGGGQAPAPLPADDPRLGERGIGRPDAPVRVLEFFSLTCSHCAGFHRDALPRIKSELIDTGQVRLVWRDFPLDRVALLASQVARSLPPERYEPFIGALLASQDRWAFTRGEPMEELGKIAALAGMSRPAFEAAARNEALGRAILEMRQVAEREYQIRATPTFVFQKGSYSKTQSGALSFEGFKAAVEEARRA